MYNKPHDGRSKAIRLGGLDVHFPHKPYGIQCAMMARIIVAYTNRQNCLVESPTGTGKSLSLICSTLAWQQRSKFDQKPFVSANYKDKLVYEHINKLRSRPCSCGLRPVFEIVTPLVDSMSSKLPHSHSIDDQHNSRSINDINVDSVPDNNNGSSSRFSNYSTHAHDFNNHDDNNGDNKHKRIKVNHKDSPAHASPQQHVDINEDQTDVSYADSEKPIDVVSFRQYDVDEDYTDLSMRSFVSTSPILTTGPLLPSSPNTSKIVLKTEAIDPIQVDDPDFMTSGKPPASTPLQSDNRNNDHHGTDSNQFCKNCLALKTELSFFDELGSSAAPAPSAQLTNMRKIHIFYGTRTHKQISQIVNELKKTSYTKNLKINILSSRDRTCINESIKDLPDRDERCKEMVRNKLKSSDAPSVADSFVSSSTGHSSKAATVNVTCPYFKDANQMIVEFQAVHPKHVILDIEDAVSYGKQIKVCPYYAMKALQDDADITFCHYNYILNPNIRSMMNINLKNSIVILDEAHNIEDICRDCASFVINTKHLDELLVNINRVASYHSPGSVILAAYDFFKTIFTDIKYYLLNYMFEHEDSQLHDNDCLARHVMSHREMLHQLSNINLGSDRVKSIKDNLKILRQNDTDSGHTINESLSFDGLIQQGTLNNVDITVIAQLTNTLELIYSNDSNNSTDFRCFVSKHFDRSKASEQLPSTVLATLSGSNYKKLLPDGHPLSNQFSLICMNPALSFKEIHDQCWSVVVASGTLSPIESLKTELGCNFSQVFEGSHVISDDRIFATIISKGPTGIKLDCSYTNSHKFDFQDELGLVVGDVCNTVPNGVLIFFPSYERMDNLYKRWVIKGYINGTKLFGKTIFREKKNIASTNFDQELKNYHNAAKRQGAVMMAVYRGKISEGMDFSDSAARAVITIGIPYPNVKEVTISLKREYNNFARETRPQIMNGVLWYQTQAMRALNQSLGRVIRHKDDWGAIIMLDSRLTSDQCLSGISKWVRRCISMPTSYQAFQNGLKHFVTRRQRQQQQHQC